MKRHFFCRMLSGSTCTCDRWDFRFFGWCLGNFLFWDNFLGNFRHLKDISSFMIRLMNSNGLESYSNPERHFFWRMRSEPTCTCDRWGFRFFGWHLGNFLFWNNFLGNFRHLKDISSFMVRVMKSNGLKSSSKTEDTFLLKNEVRAKLYLWQVGLPLFWVVPWGLSFLEQLLGELQALERY